MYSKEEIERKRLLALQRKTQRTDNNSPNTANASKPAYNTYSNQNTVPNARSSFSNYGNKSGTNKSFTSAPGSSKNFNYNRNNQQQNKSQSSFKAQSTSNRFNPLGSTKFYGNCSQQCEVTCTMINSTRFAVDTSTYNNQLIDLFKMIPTRLYDPQTKIWNFHIKDYDTFCEKVISLNSEVSFKGLHSYIVNTFKTLLLKEKEPKSQIDWSRIDKDLMSSLYPFQKEGIEYGVLKNGRCLIADDMGLGKTRQALGIANYFKDDWPLIIVTPSSVRYQWSEAIIENLSSVPTQQIHHLITTKDYLENSKITIVSYDLLSRRIDEIAAKRFGVVICDESHYLKSGKTQRTKAVQRLTKNARRLIFLTGTPALSRPIELHSQIKMLMPNFMSYQDFGFRYCAGVQTAYGWDFTGSSNLKELDILLKACCLIRRLKSEVMTQLPSKIRQKIILDPHLIKAATKEMKEASKKMEKTNITGVQKHTALLKYYNETSIAKEKAVCNYVADLLENEQKFLIFAHHQTMLDSISKLLTSKKVLFIRIDGKTNPEQRKIFVDKFQSDEKILVAVLSITAANAGITLTAAQLVIFAELYWNPGILNQAEDRVHRIGQTDNVVIRYLLAKDTADDHMWPQIQKKIDVLNEAGLDQNFDLGKADVENQLSVSHDQKTLDELFSASDQSTLDDFVKSEETLSTEKSQNSETVEAIENINFQTSSDSLKDLLDVDDDAFNDIDLDSIT